MDFSFSSSTSTCLLRCAKLVDAILLRASAFLFLLRGTCLMENSLKLLVFLPHLFCDPETRLNNASYSALLVVLPTFTTSWHSEINPSGWFVVQFACVGAKANTSFSHGSIVDLWPSLETLTKAIMVIVCLPCAVSIGSSAMSFFICLKAASAPDVLCSHFFLWHPSPAYSRLFRNASMATTFIASFQANTAKFWSEILGVRSVQGPEIHCTLPCGMIHAASYCYSVLLKLWETLLPCVVDGMARIFLIPGPAYYSIVLGR
ncbi:hypothetical protein Tco_1446612 [Tanacetum coccineum]